MIDTHRSRSPWLALGDVNFRLFFLSQFVWQSGRWLQSVAQAWLVLDLTGSPLALGTVTAAQFAPVLVFSLFSGPIADRFERHRFIMALQVISIVNTTTITLLVAGGHVQLWEIYLFAVLQGSIHAIDQPTRSAFVSEIVASEHVPSAVGLNSSISNAARIFGPAGGGVLIATAGTSWCFGLNALLYVVAYVGYRSMRTDRIRPTALGPAGRMHTQVLDGLRYVASERELLVPLLLVGFLGTVGFNWLVALPLLARYTFDIGATGFGLENAAMGLGSLAGGIFVASRPPAGALGLSRVGAVFSVVLMALAFAPTSAVALALLLIAGGVAILFTAGVSTTVQLRSRPEYRGRALGLLFLLLAGGTPIGSTLTGSVAAAYDIRVALALNAALSLVGSGAAILYLRRERRVSETAFGRVQDI